MPIDLRCGNCRVRSWRPDDAPVMAGHANHREIWLNLRDRFPHPYTIADAEAYLKLVAGRAVETSFAIDVAGAAVGGISLMLGQDIERASAELGYWLGPAYWNRGIMTAAVRAVADYGLERLGLTRVFAVPFVRNPASYRVLEKAGFHREGLLRRSAIKAGVIEDQYLYALVRRDADSDGGASSHLSPSGRVSPPAILVVTGASGAGKTTLVRALEVRGLPGVSCHYFDSVGVPSAEVMERDFGGGAAWQEATTRLWIGRLSSSPDRVAVLDGQTRPSVVRAAFREAGIRRGAIVLIDCSAGERHLRLHGAREQPELATAHMDAWAGYLRGQADALDLPIIDTTSITPDAARDQLVRLVESLGQP